MTTFQSRRHLQSRILDMPCTPQQHRLSPLNNKYVYPFRDLQPYRLSVDLVTLTPSPSLKIPRLKQMSASKYLVQSKSGLSPRPNADCRRAICSILTSHRLQPVAPVLSHLNKSIRVIKLQGNLSATKGPWDSAVKEDHC